MSKKTAKPSKKNGKTSKAKSDQKKAEHLKAATQKVTPVKKKSDKETKDAIKKVTNPKKTISMENTEKAAEDTTTPVTEVPELVNSEKKEEIKDAGIATENAGAGDKPKEEKKYDFERKFEIQGKAEFLNGIVKLGADNSVNYIRRTETYRFEFTGLMTDNKTPYTFPFDCDGDDEADAFWDELVKYEKDLAKEKKKGGSKKSQPAKVENNTSGGSVQSTNNSENFTIPKAENFDQNTIVMKRLSEYGTSIADTIKNSIQARIHGGLPHAEALKVLASCSKEFTYSIAQDAGGKYITISQGSISTRTENLPIL